MKIIQSPRKNHYLTRANIFLIVVVLIAGMVGCEGAGGESCTLTIASTNGGSVTAPGEGTFTYDQGAVIDLAAEAEAGYRFVEWTGNISTVADVYAAATNITMNGAYSITANFVAIYDLTVSSTEGGEVSTPGEGAFTYDYGAVVDLVADAEEDYEFTQWTGDVGTIADVYAAATTITVNDNCFITADFAWMPAVEYELIIASGFGGDVTAPGEGTYAYDEGGIVNIVATPFTDYVFVEWTGDVAGIADVNAASTTITINDDASITATFEWGGGNWTDPIQLDFHCTAGPIASVWEYVYQPWIWAVQNATGPDGGTFEFTITFGDTPYTPEDSLVAISNGVVDLGQLSTDTFTLGAVGYLPFIYSMESGAYVTHFIYEENWDIWGELDYVKLLIASPLQPAQWWGNVNVTEMADLSDLDVRADEVQIPIVDALGANPLSISVSELVMALNLGVVDGCFFTYSGAFWPGLCDVTDYVSEVNLVLPRCMLAMNGEVYEGLPPDARALLDEYSTADWSTDLAAIHEAAQAGVKGYIQSPGCSSKIIEAITDIEDWETACQDVFDNFVEDMDSLGFDGQGILDRIYELIDEYEAL